MAKLSEEKINEIIRLYKEIGVYSQVAKQIGCSPATVKKYCSIPIEVKEKLKICFSGTIPEISYTDLTFFIEPYNNLTTLSTQELESMKGVWNEI
jgi:hypothetical protein